MESKVGAKRQTMRKSLRACLIVPLVLALSLFVTSCSSESGGSGGSGSSESEGASVLHLNTSLSYSSATQLIMRELKLIEKYLPEGVTVEWSEIASGPDIRDAVVSGQIDIADAASSAFISAVEQGLPLIPLSNNGKAVVNVYSNRSDIKSLSDFEPTDRIAITNRATILHSAFMAQSNQDLGAYMALDTALVPAPAPETIASLGSSDEFDGAVLSFPNTVRVEEMENLTMIADMSDVIDEYGIGSLCFANEDFFDNNPALVEAYLKAQQEAVDYTTNDPEAAAELLGKIFDIPSESMLETLEAAPLPIAISEEAYAKQAEMMLASGALAKEAKPLSELKNYENLVLVD